MKDVHTALPLSLDELLIDRRLYDVHTPEKVFLPHDFDDNVNLFNFDETVAYNDLSKNTNTIFNASFPRYTIHFTGLTPLANDDEISHIFTEILKSLWDGGAISSEQYKELLREGTHTYEQGDMRLASHSVYRASVRDELTGKTTDVALKLGDSSDEARQLEVWASNPLINVPQVISSGTFNGTNDTYIMTKYIHGTDLIDLLETKKAMPLISQSLTQLVTMQSMSDRFDVIVRDDPDHFISYMQSTFCEQFLKISGEWLTDKQTRQFTKLSEKASTQYSVIGSRMARQADKYQTVHIDYSPMNLRESNGTISMLDAGVREKHSPYVAFINLTEFGRKNVDDKGKNAEYLNDAEKERLFKQMQLERAYTITNDENIRSLIDLSEGMKNISDEMYHSILTQAGINHTEELVEMHYAGVHRHLALTGYGSRDIANGDNPINEFNRQKYHMRIAVKHLKEIMRYDTTLSRVERKELKQLYKTLNGMNKIIMNQNIPESELSDLLGDAIPFQINDRASQYNAYSLQDRLVA
ncbi:MAG: hypothetical protein ACMXYE_03810 [Candidatus Woesearchaeota archaeon]